MTKKPVFKHKSGTIFFTPRCILDKYRKISLRLYVLALRYLLTKSINVILKFIKPADITSAIEFVKCTNVIMDLVMKTNLGLCKMCVKSAVLIGIVTRVWNELKVFIGVCIFESNCQFLNNQQVFASC